MSDGSSLTSDGEIDIQPLITKLGKLVSCKYYEQKVDISPFMTLIVLHFHTIKISVSDHGVKPLSKTLLNL